MVLNVIGCGILGSASGIVIDTAMSACIVIIDPGTCCSCVRSVLIYSGSCERKVGNVP